MFRIRLRTPYHMSPPCPRCGGRRTGRLLAVAPGEDIVRVTEKWLRRGELVRPVTGGRRGSFCLDCGVEWGATASVVWVTRDEREKFREMACAGQVSAEEAGGYGVLAPEFGALAAHAPASGWRMAAGGILRALSPLAPVAGLVSSVRDEALSFHMGMAGMDADPAAPSGIGDADMDNAGGLCGDGSGGRDG